MSAKKTVLALAGVALLVSGCGGSTDDGADKPPPTQARTQPTGETRTPLERAAAALATACIDGASTATVSARTTRFVAAAESAPNSGQSRNFVRVARSNLKDGCAPELASRISLNPSPPTREPKPKPKPAGPGQADAWTPQNVPGLSVSPRDAYEEGYYVCQTEGPLSGLAANRLAERFAKAYRDTALHQPSYEGCFEGATTG